MQELIFKGAFILTKYAIVTKFGTVVCSIEKIHHINQKTIIPTIKK